MNDLRRLIQTYLNNVHNVECGVAIADGLIEEGKTYFGYEIQEVYYGSDFDKNYSMRIVLTGRLVRKVQTDESTLMILNDALEEIKSALKNMNFKYSYNDVSIENGIRKIFVSAEVNYNELNMTLM